ncbi:hypothetical protein B0H15DRAFT_780142, partial [Mycena belliarum]
MDIAVEGVGETPLHAQGRGTVLLDCDVNGRIITHRLLDVLFAPTCPHNLLAVSRLDDAGLEAKFSQCRVEFVRRTDGQVMATGSKTGRLYPIAAKPRKQVQRVAQENVHAAMEASNQSWNSWH